jgi:magnesium chelatase family protein
MYGRVAAVSLLGVGGHRIVVESHVGRGLPSLTITGLPGAAVTDARDRIRPAVEHAGLEWPLRRVVVNLAPANVRKDGPGLDLPIAMSVLVATGQVAARAADGWIFAGELSLKGELVATPGVLSVAIAAARAHGRGVVVPVANAVEAAQVDGLEVVASPTLREVVGFLRGTWTPSPPAPTETPDGAVADVDLHEVRGQQLRRPDRCMRRSRRRSTKRPEPLASLPLCRARSARDRCTVARRSPNGTQSGATVGDRRAYFVGSGS